MSKIQPGFNVRVYGVLANQDKVLVSAEYYGQDHLVKFPGGGLEDGESPAQCLQREFREEAGLDIQVEEFFYTSKNFHKSYRRPMQLIALYWRVSCRQVFAGHSELRSNGQAADSFYRLYWVEIASLRPEFFTHAIDREVLAHLQAQLPGAAMTGKQPV